MKYEIKNKYIQASIEDLGAQLCSLKKVNDACEYIWQKDEKYWNRSAPILFPIVGKLKDDSYSYDENIYKMTQHGFARDCIFTVYEQKENFICFKLESNNETLKVYPFEFELFLSYELNKNTLIASFEVKNKSKSDMYFSIGAHPAFNWPLENENKNDSFIEFIDTKSINILSLENSHIRDENRNLTLEESRLFLNEKLFDNDALILKDLKHKKIKYKNLKNDRKVIMTFNNFPYLGLWSKTKGADFICLEPWHGLADFSNHNKNIKEKVAINKLEKDGVFTSAYTIKI